MILTRAALEEVPELLQRTVRMLNEALRLDPVAVSKVFTNEALINTALATSPIDLVYTCYSQDLVDGGAYFSQSVEPFNKIGALGFIAGIVNIKKYRIFREMPDDDPTTITAFGVYRVDE